MILGAGRLFPVSSPPLTEGAVLVTEGRIREIGPAGALRRKYPSSRCRIHPGCVLMPGLVNTHTHLEYSVFHALADGTPFLPWIRKLVRRSTLRNRFWGPVYWEKSAAEGIRKSFRAGITSVGDVVTFGGSPRAAAGTGIRMRAFLESVAVAPAAVPGEMKRLRELLGNRRRWSSAVQPGLSPHSIYTLSPEALAALGTLREEFDLPLSIHAAETVFERDLLLGGGPLEGQIARFGLPFTRSAPLSLISYLRDLGVLSPGALLVHGVHLKEKDLQLAARLGVRLTTCPRSNLLLGSGLPDYRLWAGSGISFTYGTDSLASVPSFDLFREARVVGEHLREGAEDVLRRLTLGGAETLGFEPETGSVEVGKAADLILLKVPNARSCRAEDIVLRASAKDVEMTMVSGRVVYTASHDRYSRGQKTPS